MSDGAINRSLRFALFAFLLGCGVTRPSPLIYAAEPTAAEPLIGRWDLVVTGPNGAFPSWFEVRRSGNSTLVGSFVGQFGSARPISEVTRRGHEFEFAIPPQWEKRTDLQIFKGTLTDDNLSGTTTDEQGRPLAWTGVRAPSLTRAAEPSWS